MLIEFINEDLAAENQSTVVNSKHYFLCSNRMQSRRNRKLQAKFEFIPLQQMQLFFTIIDGNVMSAFLVNKQTHLLKRQYHDVLFAQSTLWSVLR